MATSNVIPAEQELVGEEGFVNITEEANEYARQERLQKEIEDLQWQSEHPPLKWMRRLIEAEKREKPLRPIRSIFELAAKAVAASNR